MAHIEMTFEDYYEFINGEAKCLLFRYEGGIYFLWHNYIDSLNYYITLDRFYPDCEYNKELRRSGKLPKYGNWKHKATQAVKKLLSTGLKADLKLV